MMKTIFIFGIFFSFSAFSVCDDLARKYGDGYNQIDLVNDCFFEAKNNGSKTSSSNNEVHLYGYKNMLFVEFSDPAKYQARPEKQQIAIAGSQLGLEDFIHGSILDKRKELLILSDGKLSVFSMNRGGNVAPLFYLESEQLKHAESFFINDKDEIIVSYKGINLKRTFQLEKKKISFLAEIE